MKNFEIIENLLINAFEGGANYWYMIQDHNKATIPEVQFLSTLLMNPKGQMKISCCQIPDGKTVTHQDVLAGWERFKTKHPRHFADAIDGNDDGCTADVFLQEVVLGEVIYG
jgi:hypothetical protein